MIIHLYGVMLVKAHYFLHFLTVPLQSSAEIKSILSSARMLVAVNK